MVKQGVKNYFTSLKYFFTPLGTMFLGIMLGVSIFVPNVLSAMSSLIEGIKELCQNVNLDLNVLSGNLWDSVRALNWSEPVESVKTLFSVEWLNEVLTKELNAVLGTDFETFKARITELVNVFCGEVAVNIKVFFICWILGFVAGFTLIRFLIRRDIAKRSLWKFVLAYVLNSVLSTAMVITILFAFSLWQYSIYICLVLALIIVGGVSLLEAYLLYARKVIPIKQIVNLKNVGLYMLTNVIIFAISVCFTLVALAINKLMGVFVGLAFVAIAIIVINLNGESYVLNEVKKQIEQNDEKKGKDNIMASVEQEANTQAIPAESAEEVAPSAQE